MPSPWIRHRRARLQIAAIVAALTACQCARATAQRVAWSATELSVAFRDTIRSADRWIAAGPNLRTLEIIGLFSMPGADSASIGLRDIDLTIADAVIPAAQRRRAVLGIGLPDRTGRCWYEFFPPVADGRIETGLTGADGGGFHYSVRSQVVTLDANPSRLCVAFTIPARPITRLELRLRANRVPIPLPPNR
jgi:hypothetical protein